MSWIRCAEAEKIAQLCRAEEFQYWNWETLEYAKDFPTMAKPHQQTTPKCAKPSDWPFMPGCTLSRALHHHVAHCKIHIRRAFFLSSKFSVITSVKCLYVFQPQVHTRGDGMGIYIFWQGWVVSVNLSDATCGASTLCRLHESNRRRFQPTEYLSFWKALLFQEFCIHETVPHRWQNIYFQSHESCV